MFDEFWILYPRKVAKADARKAWNKLNEEQQLLAAKEIINHCNYWKIKETEIDFIPYPASWIRAERFEDELIIKPKKEKIDKKWMFSNEGIEAKAKELGVLGTGYDSYDSLKRKCMNKLGMSVV
jgi:hypothetical protein